MFGYCSFGYRVEQLVTHIFTSEADFEEILLHDIVTFAVYFAYLSSNLIPIGTLISFLHDVTDVPFHIAKAANHSNWPGLAPFPFIFGQLLWIFVRLICYAHLIYCTMVDAVYPPGREHLQPYFIFARTLISILYVLHWVWFYMFQRINM